MVDAIGPAVSYATPSDLEARWRPLADSEGGRAQTLLEDASQMIRDRWPGVDQRVAEGWLSANTLKRIVCAMVKRAMLTPGGDGVTQVSEAAGPWNLSQTFANPSGNLYLGKDEIAALSGVSGRRAFAVDL